MGSVLGKGCSFTACASINAVSPVQNMRMTIRSTLCIDTHAPLLIG